MPGRAGGTIEPRPNSGQTMQVKVGYELIFECAQPTPMLLLLNVHPSRSHDLVTRDDVMTEPLVAVRRYRDRFDNICTRIVAPTGRIRIWAEGIVNDSGQPDPVVPSATQSLVQDLPDDTMVFLLGSRYCETDRLSDIAWKMFHHTPLGWARVQAICDFVHSHIKFNYLTARPTRTAWEAYQEKEGVCRDFAHLAVALCRCMNIPARYCTGYISDIGLPPPYADMDFAAWFEAYLGGAWHTFDPRNNAPRWGRILMGRGRDAVDVPLSNAFGEATLVSFKVVTEEVIPAS
jgi:transglutaminase-like putative cysteine protease